MAAHSSDMRLKPSRGNSEMDVMDDETVLAEDVTQGSQEPEKMLSASRVNEIVKREKAAVAEKVRRDMEAQYAQMNAQAQSSPQAAQNLGGMEFNPADIEQKVYERIQNEYERANQQAVEAEHKSAMENVASQYFLKMGKGGDLFDDFKEVMDTFEPAAFPQVVYLAAEMDNTPELMYELSKNPQKLAAIDLMAQKAPQKAREMLERLSKSIEENKQAKASHVNTNEPLSRLKSSTVGADNGVMNMRDLKKSPLLRG